MTGTEIELKLQLSPKAAGKLARHPLLANIASHKQQLLNTYFDTPELNCTNAASLSASAKKAGNG